MKKIINGKMYNTETAEQIGYYSNGTDYSNWHRYEEGLYRKKTGEFFLHGSGGPLSRYAECISASGRSFSSGEDILPLSIDDAKEWVEDYLDADAYIEVFGDVEE